MHLLYKRRLHWSCKCYILISSLYITSLRFRRFMMIKNELELSSLNIWSFTYRKRAGGPEPRN